MISFLCPRGFDRRFLWGFFVMIENVGLIIFIFVVLLNASALLTDLALVDIGSPFTITGWLRLEYWRTFLAILIQFVGACGLSLHLR